MKLPRINPLFSLLLLSGLVIACQQQAKENRSETENSKAILAGKIKNPASDKIAVRLYGKPGNAKAWLKLNKEDGTFHGVIPVDKPGYLRLKHGGEYTTAFARPGDSIYMTLNTEQFDETLTYQGSRQTVNNYLAQKILLGDSLNLSGRQKLRELYASPPKTFKKTVDSVEKAYMQLLESELKDHEGLAPFPKMERVNIKTEFQGKRLRYPSLYPRFAGDTAESLPKAMKNYQPDLPMDDPLMTRVPGYQRMARRIVFNAQSVYVSNHPAMKDTFRGLVTSKVIDSLIPNDTLKAKMAHLFLESQITRKSLQALKPLHSYYQDVAISSVAQAKIDSLMGVKQNLKAGNEAPGFRYPTHSGDTLSLTDLEGQYVYIDVWATWCGPCIREIPYLKDLHKSLKDRNVAFVSVSVDRPNAKSKWRSMVKNKNLKGYQLFANGEAFDSKIANDYMIGAIPRFILIGPEGKIIDANAERPSGDIKARLEKLLDEKQAAA